ncbi:MAG: hypothetical protein MUF80_00995 [Burkholderiales bacterium]|nr:hypothetical protein [Burkholderiales bacterium]
MASLVEHRFLLRRIERIKDRVKEKGLVRFRRLTHRPSRETRKNRLPLLFIRCRLSRRLEERRLPPEGCFFRLFEKADDAVLPVIALFPDDFGLTHPVNRFSQKPASCPFNVFGGRIHENVKFGAEGGEQFFVGSSHLFCGRAAAEDLGEDFRQRDDAVERLWELGRFSVGELIDPVQHSDGNGFAALRTDSIATPRFRRVKAHFAFSMAVVMILAFFGKELDGALESFFLGHRFHKAVVIEPCVEKIGLSSQFLGGVSIRIGHEKVIVQSGKPAVHDRIRGEACFKSVNVAGQVREALVDRIKAGV